MIPEMICVFHKQQFQKQIVPLSGLLYGSLAKYIQGMTWWAARFGNFCIIKINVCRIYASYKYGPEVCHNSVSSMSIITIKQPISNCRQKVPIYYSTYIHKLTFLNCSYGVVMKLCFQLAIINTAKNVINFTPCHRRKVTFVISVHSVSLISFDKQYNKIHPWFV